MLLLISLILFLLNSLIPASKDIVQPPSILKGPEPRVRYFSQGNNLTIDCHVSGHPFPKITWFKDEGKISNGDDEFLISENGQTLTVLIVKDGQGATKDRQGVYRCVVENIYGTLFSDRCRCVKASNEKSGSDNNETVDVLYGQYLMMAYVDNIGNVPKGDIQWALSGDTIDSTDKTIELDDRIQIDDNGDIHFAFVQRTDIKEGAFYKSKTINRFLDSYQGGSYKKINVVGENNTNFAPTLAFGTKSIVVALDGHDFTLRCFFKGRPTPIVTWTGPREVFPEGRHHEGISSLTIKNASRSDGGKYECRGDNGGYERHIIDVTIEALPYFTSEDKPSNRNVTEGDDVTFNCSGSGDPPPHHQWIVNGKKIYDLDRITKVLRKAEISEGYKVIKLRNVCKECPHGDMTVIQCNITNTHGYQLATGYVNILMKTKAHLKLNRREYLSEEAISDKDEKTLVFQCDGVGDPSTPLKITWMKLNFTLVHSIFYGSYYEASKYVAISSQPPHVEVTEDGKLTLKRTELDQKTWSEIGSDFKCVVTNGYSSDEKIVTLNIRDRPDLIRRGLISWWWLLLLVLLLLIFIIVFVCCCWRFIKQKGNEYDVDAKEKLNGNEPEKELCHLGFKAYKRPDDMIFLKGNEPSLDSSGHCSDEDESLDDYGLVDAGKFNEDGSFVGAYITNPLQFKSRREYITSPLTKYYS